MKKIISLFGVLFVFLTLIFSGCGEEKKEENNGTTVVNDLVGQWNKPSETQKDTWTFYNDSTGRRVVESEGQPTYTESFRWQVNNNELCVTFESGGVESERCGTYAFTNEYKNAFTWTFLKGEEPDTTTYYKII